MVGLRSGAARTVAPIAACVIANNWQVKQQTGRQAQITGRVRCAACAACAAAARLHQSAPSTKVVGVGKGGSDAG